MNWVRQQLANVAGTQEPVHGAEAIQSVAKQTEKTPYTVLKKEDLRWATLEVTSVETQTFYILTDSGHVVMAQVIYSNVAGMRVTCQFSTKVTYPDRSKPNLWCSDPLENYEFDEDQLCFWADGLAVDLDDDANTYTIKSAVNDDCFVDCSVTRIAPGFQVGENGTTNFGTDPAAPWGSMRHAFWPRCEVKGSLVTKDETIDVSGRGFFVYALQGMKPHHAAARWNFVNFQSPTYSAIMMEFITPASYGNTCVNVGCIATDNAIISAGATNTAEHTASRRDTENDWPEPTAVKYTWDSKGKNDGKDMSVHASLEADLGERIDRVDVMYEIPGWVRSIVAATAGTKPYIYQYCPTDKKTLHLKLGDEAKEEAGTLYCEATFIC